MFAQDGDEVVVRVALVQEHGLAGGGGEFELPAESAALQIARGKVAKIVEPAFAHGDDVRVRARAPATRAGCPR